MCGLNKFVDNFDFKSFLSNYDIKVLCETWSKFKGEFNNFLSYYVHFDFVRKGAVTLQRMIERMSSV